MMTTVQNTDIIH